MFSFFKKIFCKHNYNLKILVETKDAFPHKFRAYKYVCSKCGSESFQKKFGIEKEMCL